MSRKKRSNNRVSWGHQPVVITQRLTEPPETYIDGKDLIPLSPEPINRIAAFFDTVPDADAINFVWEIPGGEGRQHTSYFAFNAGGGYGCFLVQQQWAQDDRHVWDHRVRISLEMKELGREHQPQGFVEEYSVVPDGPEHDPESALAAVFAIIGVVNKNFVSREEMLRRRQVMEAGKASPVGRTAGFETVYRN